MSATNTILFIGGGNMAAALIGGLRAAQPGTPVEVVEPLAERRAWLQAHLGVACHEALDPLNSCRYDAVLLAVKPQILREVCAALRPLLGGALFISIAAGIRAADIGRWLGTDRVVRAMPNTPATIGRGITGMAALPGVAPPDRDLATRLLGAVGKTVWLDSDAAIDAVTAVSGSGPAYVYWFIEVLAEAACDLGLPPAVALTLALETFSGAAQLAAAAALPPATLRAQVTSKGGTTAAAIAVLEASGARSSLIEAVRAACRRGAELGEAAAQADADTATPRQT